MAQDYMLLLGMPGTGKSSTIVQAVKALVAAGRSVLLMSYTNRCTYPLPVMRFILAPFAVNLSVSIMDRCHATSSNMHQRCQGLVLIPWICAAAAQETPCNSQQQGITHQGLLRMTMRSVAVAAQECRSLMQRR